MPLPSAQSTLTRYRRAFSSLALMVALLVCAAAAVVGIPRWCMAGEREKATDALIYLESVKQAQASFYEINGHYSADIHQLEVRHPSPTHFSIDYLEADCGSKTWSISLKRSGTWKYFGEYSLACTQDGYDANRSTADPQLMKPCPTDDNQNLVSQ